MQFFILAFFALKPVIADCKRDPGGNGEFHLFIAAFELFILY